MEESLIFGGPAKATKTPKTKLPLKKRRSESEERQNSNLHKHLTKKRKTNDEEMSDSPSTPDFASSSSPQQRTPPQNKINEKPTKILTRTELQTENDTLKRQLSKTSEQFN